MKTFVVSLGGSVIVPEEVDYRFLKSFKKLILKFVKKQNRFAIICGGGKTCRKYQQAAAKVSKLAAEDLDWLGIHATRLNAHLLRTIFRGVAHPRVIHDFSKKISFKEGVLIASGWLPGCSTDYDAVLLAKKLNTKTIINISDTDYVYDKDPRRNKSAKPIKRMCWKDFRKLVGNRWDPGLNLPFDPVASKEAQKAKMQVVIVGKNTKNLGDFLSSKPFKGTIIE
jgi:uridylate kinase